MMEDICLFGLTTTQHKPRNNASRGTEIRFFPKLHKGAFSQRRFERDLVVEVILTKQIYLSSLYVQHQNFLTFLHP